MDILFTIVGIALWLFAGYAAWRIRYYSMLKTFWVLFNRDYRTYNNGNNAINTFSSPVYFIGLTLCGLISYIIFVLILTPVNSVVWKFEIPDKQ